MRSGTPPVWSPCQCVRRTWDRLMNDLFRVDDSRLAHSGMP